jgi:hypothetical protein
MAIGNILGYTAGANGKWHEYVLGYALRCSQNSPFFDCWDIYAMHVD